MLRRWYVLYLHDFCLLFEKSFRVWSANHLSLLNVVLSPYDALTRVLRLYEAFFKLDFFG